VDLHPQLKIPAVVAVFTKLGAGGKFDGESYKHSGGLHGVGAAVANALSEVLDVTVWRDGGRWEMKFQRGVRLARWASAHQAFGVELTSSGVAEGAMTHYSQGRAQGHGKQWS
jgi:DNA gyrase/topoisomerase IV subunit B